MSNFQANGRAAAAAFLRDYAKDAGLRMQVYEGRPASLNPPTGFVDVMREAYSFTGPTLVQRVLQIDVLVIHGLFDSKDAAAQKDAFVDGLLAWTKTRPHQIEANTVVGLVSAEDVPAWTPDWLPPENTKTYYATTLTLRGEALE